ncbi:MAG: ATP synthase F1 subunit epsilon [Rhodobiaceae bacterium]|nr:ATP synthase F1 subunit epsilon [Rhodobiaceae bacterium]RPF97424.1 MAG: ATP synthase F1 subunit epsilon [Rhizobiales bacterium TMED227]|tara:strand:+ start:877 stop:1275 length:399 start_codon:yes stop_codon:yes gene_type:complete
MDKFKLEFVTPEKSLLSSEVEQVIIPGSEGEFTILADHSPMISSLKPGLISIYEDSSSEAVIYFVTDGFIDMASNNLTILAQSVIEKSQITTDKLDEIIESFQKEVDSTENLERKNRFNLKIDNVRAVQSQI